MYQPVFLIGNGWFVGKIENHVARPLTEEETCAVCDILNNREVTDMTDGFETASDLLTAFKEDLGRCVNVEVNGVSYFSEPDVLTLLRIMKTKGAVNEGKNRD